MLTFTEEDKELYKCHKKNKQKIKEQSKLYEKKLKNEYTNSLEPWQENLFNNIKFYIDCYELLSGLSFIMFGMSIFIGLIVAFSIKLSVISTLTDRICQYSIFIIFFLSVILTIFIKIYSNKYKKILKGLI